jgi:hypothetical protein
MYEVTDKGDYRLRNMRLYLKPDKAWEKVERLPLG